MTRSKIEEIEATGSDGMFRAFINIDNHSRAVEVIGETFDQCITRAVIVRDALNATKIKERL